MGQANLSWFCQCLAILLFLNRPVEGGIIFNFTDGTQLAALQSSNAALYNSVRNGFQEAANIYSAKFTDNVTLNVSINFTNMGSPTILGSTSNVELVASYDLIRNALIADATSSIDAQAVASLQTTSGLDFISRSSNADLRSNLTDNWSRFLAVSRSNLKALGLIAPTNGANGSEGSITFNSAFNWDFDRTNGISGSQFDFVGVAAHEIGHLLGFTSGVDTVDQFAATNDLKPFAVFNTLDLFRYSSTSLGLTGQPVNGAVLDLKAGGSPYFSLDAGLTSLGTFSTGSVNGDGRQASHWKDNLGLGLLDPTFSPGELGVLTALDITAFDAIGWNSSSVAVPEPSALLGLSAVFLFRRFRRRTSDVATVKVC